MKTEVIICVLVLILTAFSGNVMAGSEVDSNTLYGRNAGSSITGGHDNTFIGYYAGQKNDIGIITTANKHMNIGSFVLHSLHGKDRCTQTQSPDAI